MLFRTDPFDRIEILDTLHRFAAGQDFNDRALFESAFSATAKLDITGPGKKLGIALPILEGRQMIGEVLMAGKDRLFTTHAIANEQISFCDGKSACFTALVDATNIPRDDEQRFLQLMNLYTVDVSKGAEHWTIDHLVIENMWVRGDPEVLFPKENVE